MTTGPKNHHPSPPAWPACSCSARPGRAAVEAFLQPNMAGQRCWRQPATAASSASSASTSKDGDLPAEIVGGYPTRRSWPTTAPPRASRSSPASIPGRSTSWAEEARRQDIKAAIERGVKAGLPRRGAEIGVGTVENDKATTSHGGGTAEDDRNVTVLVMVTTTTPRNLLDEHKRGLGGMAGVLPRDIPMGGLACAHRSPRR